MKNFFCSISILFIGFYLFFAPIVVFAAGGAGASFDVVAGQQAPKVSLTYPWSNLRDPSALVNLIFKMALGIAGAAALGMLIYGAVLWTVSGAISSKQDAMERIQGAIWGLVLLLGSYLILYTVNPDLVELKTPDELMAPVNLDVLETFKNTNPPATGLTENVARSELSQANIGVKSACPVGQELNCVNLNGIRQGTLNEVVDLASRVGSGSIYVTAGTEGCGTIHVEGAQSHCTGYKVDLRYNSTITDYIINNFQAAPNSSPSVKKYISPSGAIYTLEEGATYGIHWDVLVKQL